MRILVLITGIVASVAAKPTSINPTLVHSDVLAPAGIPTQYHVQDITGQYAYGYTDGISSKQELKTADGVTRGAYTYVDAKGDLQTVDYISDPVNGFQVAGTNLPKAVPIPEPVPLNPVTDTPEVLRAKELHFAAFLQEAKLREGEPTDDVDRFWEINGLPKQVEDTPEVAELLAGKKEPAIRNSLVVDIDVRVNNINSTVSPTVKTEKHPSKFVYTVCTPIWHSNILSTSKEV